MQITRTSKLTGIIRTLELDITDAQIREYSFGVFVQHCFPNLTPDEREFFITGITKEEWDMYLGEEE